MRTPTITQTNGTLTVAKGKSLVYGFALSTNNAAGNAIFYNGASASDREIIRLYVAAQTSTHIMLPKPIVFDRGITIVSSATTGYASVIWDSYIEEKER